MDKHYVLDIQYAGKAFARLQMFTPRAADQLEQACALFPAAQGYQVQLSQSANAASSTRAARKASRCWASRWR